MAVKEKPEGEIFFQDHREGGLVVLFERSEVKTAPLTKERLQHSLEGFLQPYFFQAKGYFFWRGRFRPCKKASGYNALLDLAPNSLFLPFEKNLAM